MVSKRFRSTGRGTCRVCKRSVAASRMGVHLKSHLSDFGGASRDPRPRGGSLMPPPRAARGSRGASRDPYPPGSDKSMRYAITSQYSDASRDPYPHTKDITDMSATRDASRDPRPTNSDRGSHYVIRVDDKGPFWMFLQVPGAHTLKDVDDFLRDEWLEGEVHLSVFTIDGIKYDSEPESAEHGESSMHYPLQDVLNENMVFPYEYDFGATTSLRFTVTAARVPPLLPREGTAVLAIHDTVGFVCDACGGDATLVCAYCSILFDGSLLCDDCIEDHECYRSDPDAILEVVQSPRVGMCNFESPPKTLHVW